MATQGTFNSYFWEQVQRQEEEEGEGEGGGGGGEREKACGNKNRCV